MYPELRQAALDQLIKALEAAAQLELSFVTIHPGSSPSWFTPRDQSLSWCLEMLRKLLGIAEQHDLMLGLENLPPRPSPNFCFSNLQDLSWILENLDHPRLWITLDLAHAHLVERSAPIEFLEQLYPKIKHLHLSDNFGRDDLHLPLGAGNLDYQALIRSLMERGYAGCLSLEIFTSHLEYIKLSKRILEGILKGSQQSRIVNF